MNKNSIDMEAEREGIALRTMRKHDNKQKKFSRSVINTIPLNNDDKWDYLINKTIQEELE